MTVDIGFYYVSFKEKPIFSLQNQFRKLLDQPNLPTHPKGKLPKSTTRFLKSRSKTGGEIRHSNEFKDYYQYIFNVRSNENGTIKICKNRCKSIESKKEPHTHTERHKAIALIDYGRQIPYWLLFFLWHCCCCDYCAKQQLFFKYYVLPELKRVEK